MKFKATNYEGQIFGTRQIIRNTCTEEELISHFGSMPKNPSRYRMGKCLICGNEAPILVSGLIKNPPKRCALCSGINNKSKKESKTNTWTLYDDYAVLNILHSKGVTSAYIDLDDYEKVSSRVWRVSKKKNKYYLVSGSKRKGNDIYMHRLIMDSDIPDGYEVDHIDGNSLNNRRDNLRIVTRIQNIQNSKARIDNKIGIRGISKYGNRYIVDFSFNNKRYYFTHWLNLQDAVYCRNFAEKHFDLHMLENNPLAKQYLTGTKEYESKMMSYVESVINNTKVSV